MELVAFFKKYVLKLNESLPLLIAACGGWTYLILFVIIFCETGLVVTPFLPGDSLLFASGSLSATIVKETGKPVLNLWAVLSLLSLAAILGDAVNYSIGHIFGNRLLNSKSPRIRNIFKPEYIEKTHKFYEKYGKKAIILARFVPIVRTFIPFMAGLGSMTYAEFAAYNVIGGIAWVSLMTGSGYFLGTIPWIQKHFEMVVIAIIIISILPMVYEVWAHKREQAQKKTAEAEAARLAGAAKPEEEDKVLSGENEK